ncbi:MAG: beta-L-arabinofuranosidase domain-containing protein [Acidobacteriaceae bacterium]
MSVTRRSFLISGACTTGVALTGGMYPRVWALPENTSPELTPYLTGMKMAATPATHYRAYRSRAAQSPSVNTWVQIDLKKAVAIEAIQLFPACEKMFPGRDQYYGGEGFPLRFKIEAADDEAFSRPRVIADFTQADFPDPKNNVTQYAAHGATARYVRVTATKLRTVKIPPAKEFAPLGVEPVDSKDFTLTIAKIAVLSAGRDVAGGCQATADAEHGNTEEELKQLTRAPRQDGEDIRMDHPNLVTDASGWKRPQFKAEPPKTGVTLAGGVFQAAMEHNIQYLLNTYTVEQLLRQFYERTGKVTGFKPTGTEVFWEEDLAGSNAGRFLMGAGNTVRWIDDPELRRRLNAVVDGIEECRQPNGYIMAYPENTIFYSERAAYTRAWLTHGLLEAGYAGNAKALPMLRGYYDWFNQQPFLPLMLRGAIQGGQGMIANTRVSVSAVGKPEDAQVIQRYYQEDGWLHGLARREKEQVWQYPYDRPHCYLLTNLEAYMDMYLVTGDMHYYDAVLGAWELYREHWQQRGGSISIIEFQKDPPDSNYLQKDLGELCGSSFWVFLSQRFQMLHPDDERFAAEIEKSLYNVGMANQDGGAGLRYHTKMQGKKEASTHENTCCEGQGTRLLGSLPEHIYSIALDGIYLHLYEPSTLRWEQNGQPMALAVDTRFPFGTEVKATVKAGAASQAKIRIRVPSWATGKMPISVNGRPAATGNPGSYVVLDREWADGDTLEFSLPASLRVKRYAGDDQIPGKTKYSIEYGPILLAAVGSPEVDLVLEKGKGAESLADHLEADGASPLHFTMRGNLGQKFIPYWQVSSEEFTCFPCVSETA